MTQLLRSTCLALAGALTLALSGCPSPVQVPADGIAGQILWDGQPAPGRTVTLVRFTDSVNFQSMNVNTVSDRNGYYQFPGLQAGAYGILYVADALPGSNEFLWWRSAPVGVGDAVPPFDVSYNDVVYPPVSTAIRPPVTLFWSSARQGNRYKVNLYATPNGYAPGTGPGTKPSWESEWTSDLQFTMATAQALPPGNYAWSVYVDGGDRGVGESKRRSLIVQN